MGVGRVGDIFGGGRRAKSNNFINKIVIVLVSSTGGGGLVGSKFLVCLTVCVLGAGVLVRGALNLYTGSAIIKNKNKKKRV